MNIDLQSMSASEAERQAIIEDSAKITEDCFVGWLSDNSVVGPITKIRGVEHQDGLYPDEQLLAKQARALMPADYQLILDAAEEELKLELSEDYHDLIAAKIFVRADITGMTFHIRQVRAEEKS
jgi:hypothetical protein